VEAGQQLPIQTYQVTRADLVCYAGASGDFNPIHWSDRFATGVGLPGVIAHGMFTMALAGRALTTWAGRPDGVVDFAVRFTRPVPVPDDDAGTEVAISGVVDQVTPESFGVSITATCDGQKVLGRAHAVLMCRRG
jgi:acyl dehydratase